MDKIIRGFGHRARGGGTECTEFSEKGFSVTARTDMLVRLGHVRVKKVVAFEFFIKAVKIKVRRISAQ